MSSKLMRTDRVEVFEYPAAVSGTDQTTDQTAGEQAELLSTQEIYQQGYQEGERAALEKAEGQLDEVRKRLVRSIQELGNTRQSVIDELEQDLVKLALEIAKKLVHREIQIDEQIILTLVRVALERMGDGSRLTVFVCPSDHGVLREHLHELSNGGDPTWVLKIDPSLQRGDCRIESESGSVNATMAEQFREIEDGLLGEL